MTQFLVSTPRALFSFSPENKEEPFKIEHKDFGSYWGITEDPNGTIYVAANVEFQGVSEGEESIIYKKKSGKWLHFSSHPDLQDVHEILYHNNLIYLVNTRTDSIYRCSKDQTWMCPLELQIPGYEIPGRLDQPDDILHLNSMVESEKFLYVTGHAYGNPPVLFRLNSYKETMSACQLPGNEVHHVWFEKGSTYTVSSGDSTVYQNWAQWLVFHDDWYLRGLAVEKETIWLGCSLRCVREDRMLNCSSILKISKNDVEKMEVFELPIPGPINSIHLLGDIV